jgi:alpha-D-xyloside xylohydrolase
MLRALFVEYPNDPGSWLIDDEYLFGSDLLVAPLFESVKERNVYLPPGAWIDYQSGEVYQGGWNVIKAGAVPAIVLVRAGAVIPHIKLAQSTMQMDWSAIDLVSYALKDGPATGLICLPSDNMLHRINLNGQKLTIDPYHGKVGFNIKSYTK